MTAPALGLDTFDYIPTDSPRTPATGAETIRRILEEALPVDRLEVDAFTIGGNHQSESPAPSSDMMLAPSRRALPHSPAGPSREEALAEPATPLAAAANSAARVLRNS